MIIPRSKIKRQYIDLVDVLGFVHGHPQKHLAFPGWFDEQITKNLIEYNKFNGLVVSASADNKIDAILTYDAYPEKKLLRIQAILARDNDGFATLIAVWAKRYPDYDLEANRKGHKVTRYRLKDFSRYFKQGIEKPDEAALTQ